MVFRKFVLFLILLQITLYTNAQMDIFYSLQDAIQASQKSKKDLIILRTDLNTLRFSKEQNYPTPCSYVDELLKSNAVQDKLKDNFVLFLYDQRESSIEDQNWVKGNYFYDFAPNMIILSPQSKTLSYLKLEIYELDFDLVGMIHSSLLAFAKDSKRLNLLEEKYDLKSINPDELTELILMRAKLSVRSKDYWNYFANLSADIPRDVEFGLNTFCKEDFSVNDPFFQSLMAGDKTYDNDKLSLLKYLMELRYMENDAESYNYLSAIHDSIMKSMLTEDDEITEQLNTFIPDYETALEEENSMKLIEMYSKAGKDSLLIVESEQYVQSLMNGREERIENLKKSKDVMLELLKETLVTNLPPSDTAFSWDEFKKQAIESELKSLDRVYSNDLNQIAWAYYELVESPQDLNKAIKWCQMSIDLNSGRENNDTLAHLYYKTGNRQKAVEFQTIALNLAESSGLRQDRLKYYADELEKFKSQ